MLRLQRFIQSHIVSGTPLIAGEATVTPQSQLLIVRWPSGGFIWNRPIAILVERGAQTQRIPIRDLTRIFQIGLLGLSVVCTIVSWSYMRRKEE
jgi:hypothetical protein